MTSFYYAHVKDDGDAVIYGDGPWFQPGSDITFSSDQEFVSFIRPKARQLQVDVRRVDTNEVVDTPTAIADAKARIAAGEQSP